MTDINKWTDQQIVEAILQGNSSVTAAFFYKKCFPLFNSIFSKYHTDCENCFEFIDEIFVYVMTPNKTNGRSALANFSFRCSLTFWLKLVALNYCKQLFAKQSIMIKNNFTYYDSLDQNVHSLQMSMQRIDRFDIDKVLDMMPNERYRTLIRYRHVECHTNEETAAYLLMSMSNYYNKHRLAKAQFLAALRKEGLL